MPYERLEVDLDSTKRRNVSVYVEDRKTIWLSIDDVAWVVQYLYTQNQLKGIPMVAANDAGPGAPPHHRWQSLVKEKPQLRMKIRP